MESALPQGFPRYGTTPRRKWSWTYGSRLSAAYEGNWMRFAATPTTWSLPICAFGRNGGTHLWWRKEDVVKWVYDDNLCISMYIFISTYICLCKYVYKCVYISVHCSSVDTFMFMWISVAACIPMNDCELLCVFFLYMCLCVSVHVCVFFKNCKLLCMFFVVLFVYVYL